MPRASKNNKSAIKSIKKAVPIKLNPHIFTFANISLVFKHKKDNTLEENEFRFIIATAIQTLHGEVANEAHILSFQALDSQSYKAIIKFKTIHYTRVVTSLILFGEWKGADCKVEINKVAQTPCLLTF